MRDQFLAGGKASDIFVIYQVQLMQNQSVILPKLRCQLMGYSVTHQCLNDAKHKIFHGALMCLRHSSF